MTIAQFAAVDWGTSGFRLWLIGPDDTVLAERKSHEGMTTAAEIGFAGVLESHLTALDAPPDIPVIICGMAGARQGWVEAGYADVPTGLDGLAGRAVQVHAQPRDIRILPGLAQRSSEHADVIRGEETQLLGAASAMTGPLHRICMPGTHCKWVSVENGIVTGFSTYMTGELFAVISKSTILKHAVKDSAGVDEASRFFTKAIQSSYDRPEQTTNRLFSIRARGLLLGAQPGDSEATLSGILIGLEMAGALGSNAAGNSGIILVAEGRLARLYGAALTSLDIPFHLINADAAVLGGLTKAAHAIWPNLAK